MFVCECGRAHRIRVAVRSSDEQAAQGAPAEIESRGVLTSFERDVISKVAAGLTDGEVARLLGVSVGRVRYGVRSAIARLAARTRAEAVYHAVQTGQLEPVADVRKVVAQSGARMRLSALDS